MGLSPDGATVVTAGADETIRFWEIFGGGGGGSVGVGSGRGSSSSSSSSTASILSPLTMDVRAGGNRYGDIMSIR